MSNSTTTSSSERSILRNLERRLADHADGWFARAKAAALDSLPCRSGCHQCCIGPFAITVLDVARLHAGLSAVPRSRSRDIRSRAAAMVADIERVYPRLAAAPFLDDWADAEIDRLVTDFQDRSCPALQADGTCGIYDWRPLTCRLMGVPEESDGLVHGACQIQTSVPIVREPEILRQDEERLAQGEAAALQAFRRFTGITGEEVLLPYGFVDERMDRGSGAVGL